MKRIDKNMKKEKMSRSEAGKLGGLAYAKNSKKRALEKYYDNPAICKFCGKIIKVKDKINNFFFQITWNNSLKSISSSFMFLFSIIFYPSKFKEDTKYPQKNNVKNDF